MKFLRHPQFVVFTLSSAGLLSSASAQTRTKQDNTTSLNQASSYVENSTIPNASITLKVDNTLTATRTSSLGGNLSVLGIDMTAAPVSGASRQLQVNATTGATLTIFGGGITKASNTSALIFNNAIALGANQTWTLNSVTGTGTGNLQLNTTSFSDAGFDLAINGTGILDLRPSGSLTLSSKVTIDSAVSVNNANAVITLEGANTFNSLSVPNGRIVGSTIGDFGVASNFGDGGTNTAITLGNTTNGTLEYTGTTTTTNRTVNRDARSSASGIEVTNASTTLTISGNLGSGTQVNAGSNGWVFGGAGNLTLNGAISNATGVGSTGTTLTKNGGGTLKLGSASSTFTGNTEVNGGSLVVNGNTSTSVLTTVKTGATLGGTGTVGTLVVESNGALAPGDGGIESLNVVGNLTLNSGSISNFEINTAGDIADLAISSAILTFGGTLNVTRIGSALVAGDTFNLFDWASATGTFSSVNLPGLDAGLAWDQSNLYSTGTISVAAIPEPGAALLGGLGLLALLRRHRA